MDNFDGQGGSYVVDPKTGERRLVERTQEQPTEQPSQPEPPPATEDKD